MRFPKRNIITYKTTFDLKKKYKQNNGAKPVGIWYSYYGSWYKFIIDNNMNEELHDNIYKINIKKDKLTNINLKDKDKILLINNVKDFDKFTKKYKTKNKLINWKDVANDFGGIEIAPYFSEKRFTYWYYPWDVASGCIWNLDIIKNIELSFKKVKGEYKKI